MSDLISEASRRTLPQGWRWVRLGDVCNIVIGRTPSRIVPEYWKGGLPWVSIADLNNDIVFDTKEKITARGAEDSRSRLIKAGTLLFSFKLTIGKMALAGIDLYTNEAIAALTPKGDLQLDRDFLRFALRSIDLADGSSQAVKGRTLNQDSLTSIGFPLPSTLADQQRIAATLRECLAAIEQARAATAAQLAAANALPAAYLRQIFASDEAQDWPQVRLGEVCIINPSRPKLERSDDTETTFVPMAAVEEQGGTVARPELRPYSEVRKGYTYFAEGDVLFAKITPCMENGKHAIARNLEDGIGFGSTEFHVLRPSQAITAEWVYRFVRQPVVLEAAARTFSGSVGQQRVPDSFLSSLEIPLPPLDKQQEKMAQLNEQMQAVDQLRARLQAQLSSINQLPAALLRQAFNGEL